MLKKLALSIVQLLDDLTKLPEKMEIEEQRRERTDRREGRMVTRTWGAGCEGRRLVHKTIERFHVR
jgi:hypothetical protein